MKYLWLITLLISGCLSQSQITSTLSECPQNVQDNVGDIYYLPWSWGTVMLMSGVTDVNTGEIWLTAWADEDTVLHEAAHSVYIRTPHDEFLAEFKQKQGFVSIWSIGVQEEIAEAFVEGMKGRSNPKIDLAMQFFEGKE